MGITSMSEKQKQALEQELFGYLSTIVAPNAHMCERLWQFHSGRMRAAPGSSHNHQSWAGGYLCHLVDIIRIAKHLYVYYESYDGLKLDFTFGDVVLVLFLHDLEKPWKYIEPKEDLSNERKEYQFKKSLIRKYGIQLTKQHEQALRYIHGEGNDHCKDACVMNSLGAICHSADTLSARVTNNVMPPLTL